MVVVEVLTEVAMRSSAKEEQRDAWRCEPCGAVFPPEQTNGAVVPYHDFPRPCRSVCPGSKRSGLAVQESIPRKPLNGRELRPLSQFAIEVLEETERGPVLRSSVNPGVASRLWCEDLVETVDLPPEAPRPGERRTSKRTSKHLRITEAGRQRLAEIRANGQPS